MLYIFLWRGGGVQKSFSRIDPKREKKEENKEDEKEEIQKLVLYGKSSVLSEKRN